MKIRSVLGVFMAIMLLSGCAGQAEPQETELPRAEETTEETVAVVPETIMPELEAVAMAEEPPAPAVAVVLQPEASGEQLASSDRAEIDYSHTEDGYVMVRFTGQTEKRLKVQVKGPKTTYSYNLPQEGWTVFPLSDGDGDYQIGVYENVTGKKYAVVMTQKMQVQLLDEFVAFLRPNQYVNYSEATNAVATGLEVTAGREDPIEKVEAVYDFVVAHLKYDYEKAKTVKSGYLPDLDMVLEEQKGICFDYAALMTAMLRSQGIPCKLVVGYAGSAYHAWISVWTEESGWVDGAIFFDGQQWRRMDPTFASSSEGDEAVMDFIQNGKYTVKYLY